MVSHRRTTRRATTSTRGIRSSVGSALALIAIGAICFSSAVASAQPDGAPVPDEPPPPEIDPVDQKARDLYTEGEAAYSRGRYDEAVAKFQEAYELSKRPLLLFNLANTYERMGAYADASAALRRYIESPDATNVEAVRQRIRNLDARATEARDLEDELAALRERPPCADPIVCPALPV